MATYLGILGVALVVNTIHVAVTGHQIMLCLSGCN